MIQFGIHLISVISIFIILVLKFGYVIWIYKYTSIEALLIL